VDSLEKVLEKLATTEKTTIAIAREVGGKIRVTSGFARKARKPDEWGPPIAAYDPYGPGTGVAGDDDFVAGDA
jgi:hypothetical protein